MPTSTVLDRGSSAGGGTGVPGERRTRVRWAVVLLWLVVVVPALPVREVMPPDESRFAHQAQNMKETGDWIVPRIGDVPNADKPPVLFWAIDVVSWPLPRVNEITARVPSALGALVVLLLTARLGRRLYGSEELGLAAAAILLTGAEFAQKAQWCSCDMPLAAFVLVTVTLWREALFETAPVRGAVVLGWFAAALGSLTKGPLGLMWPALWIGAEWLARRGTRRSAGAAWWPWPAGGAAYGAIVFGWLGAFRAHASGALAHEALVKQTVERYLHSWNNVQPPWFFLYQTPLDLLPWSLFLPAAAWYAVRAWRGAPGDERTAVRTLVVVVAVALLFFSSSPGKRGVYLLPAFPALALLLARVFVPAAGGATPAAWRRVPLALLAVLGGLLAVAPALALRAAVRVVARLVERAGSGWVVALVVMGLALALGASIALRRERRDGRPAWRPLAAGLAVLWLAAGTLGGAAWSRYQDGAAFGRAVAATVPPATHLLVERGKFELVLFYSRLHGTEFEDLDHAAALLDRPGPHWVVLSAPAWRDLAARPAAQGLREVLRRRVSNVEFVVAGPA